MSCGLPYPSLLIRRGSRALQRRQSSRKKPNLSYVNPHHATLVLPVAVLAWLLRRTRRCAQHVEIGLLRHRTIALLLLRETRVDPVVEEPRC